MTSAALQAALDCALPGATIILKSATVYQGNFILRYRAQSSTTPLPITIQSDQYVATGTRVNPIERPTDEASMAWLRVPAGSTKPVLATELRDVGDTTRAAASHYRLHGIKFFTKHWVTQLVRLGTATETRRRELPKDIAFDRCYFAGSAGEGSRQGLVANARDIRVTNSYFKDFKDTSSDAQAIVAWNGAGPFVIANNYLEGSGQNVMFGGDDPSIRGLVPANITIVQNHFFKPIAWTTARSTRRGSSFRQKWLIKNLFELKNAESVRVEGNVFENNWIQGDQQGFAIVFTPRNQDGAAPWSRVQNVEFRDNLVKNSIAGFDLVLTDGRYPSQPLARVVIENNLLVNINGDAVPRSNPGTRPGRLFQILNPISESLAIDLLVTRNTAFSTREVTFSARNATSGFTFSANVVRHNPCTAFNDCGISGNHTAPGDASLDRWFSDSIVTGNILFDAGDTRSRDYPTGNRLPPSVTFRSDCDGSTATIDQTTGLASGDAADYTAVGAACEPVNRGVDWARLKPLVDRAISGKP